MRAAIFAALLVVGTARAVPITLSEFEPCVEKTLITRKAPPRNASPAKPSAIIAWVTVRSGGPSRPDAPRCTEETMVYDLPEPELLGFEPEVDAPIFWWEEPEPIEWEPFVWRFRWDPIWIIAPPRIPPSTTPPGEEPPSEEPPVSVPEPGTLALLGLGLLGIGLTRRKPS